MPRDRTGREICKCWPDKRLQNSQKERALEEGCVRGAEYQNLEIQPTQRLTQNADARTASAFSLYPAAAKGFASLRCRSLSHGSQKQRARPIPHAEWPSGRDWRPLSDSLGASGKVLNNPLGSGVVERSGREIGSRFNKPSGLKTRTQSRRERRCRNRSGHAKPGPTSGIR